MHKVKIWFQRVLVLLTLGLIGGIIKKVFGESSEIARFYNENILFTPYNITGIIMVVLATFGVWCGKKRGHTFFKVVSTVAEIMTILSLLSTAIHWLRLDKIVGQETNDEIHKLTMRFRIIGIVVISIVILSVLLWGIFKIKARLERKKQKKDKENESNNILMKAPLEVGQINPKGFQNCLKEKGKVIKSPAAKDLDTVKDGLISNQSNLISTIIVSDNTSRSYKIGHKICPSCGGKLVKRQNHSTEEWFMGCENYFSYINCKFTVSYSEYKKCESSI